MKAARGFTLIEVIVALTVLILTLGTLVAAQIGAAKLSTNSLMVSQVTTLADHRLEQVGDQLLANVEVFNKYRDDGECRSSSNSRGCNFEAKDDLVSACSPGQTCDIDGDQTADVFLVSPAKELVDDGSGNNERDLDLDGDGTPEAFLGYDMDYYLDSSDAKLLEPDIYVTTWLAYDKGSIQVTVAALPRPHLSEQVGRLDPVFLTRTVSCYDVQWETKANASNQNYTPYRGTAPPSCP